MIKHVQKQKNPGFYLLTGWQKNTLVNEKNPVAAVRMCSVKKDSQKFRKTHRKAPAMEFLRGTSFLEFLFIRGTGLRCFHVNSAKF